MGVHVPVMAPSAALLARTIAATTLKGTLPMLSAGNPFPNFSLPNQDGKITKLSDFAGHWLVVYFYPKDDTPGCTLQAKSFTATKADFDAAGIKVIGISADDVASHKNFRNKFAFTIDLLSDPDA